MTIDPKRCFCTTTLQKQIAVATSIPTQGLLMVRTFEAGVEKIRPCEGIKGEIPVGFSMETSSNHITNVIIDSLTMSRRTDNYQCTATLSHPNLVAYTDATTVDARIYLANGTELNVGNRQLYPQYVTDSSKYHINPQTGVLTLYQSEALKKVSVMYRYWLTAAEAVAMFGQITPIQGNLATWMFQIIDVYAGSGQMYTMEYDQGGNYDMGPELFTYPGGRISTNTKGTSLKNYMRVTKAPGAGDLNLGVQFKI